MPYIKQEERQCLHDLIKQIERSSFESPGELNYAITLLIKKYMAQHGKSYAIANNIVGVLECAKQEFYRRIVAPYEDTKIMENGDVYGPLS